MENTKIMCSPGYHPMSRATGMPVFGDGRRAQHAYTQRIRTTVALAAVNQAVFADLPSDPSAATSSGHRT